MSNCRLVIRPNTGAVVLLPAPGAQAHAFKCRLLVSQMITSHFLLTVAYLPFVCVLCLHSKRIVKRPILKWTMCSSMTVAFMWTSANP